MQHTVLNIDQAGEHHFRQHLFPFGAILHQAQEHAISVDHLAAMNQGHPVIQAFLQRAFQRLRLLIRPVGNRRGRGFLHHAVTPMPGIMTRRLVQLLVPDIQAGRDVPDGLRHRQHRQMRGQHPVQVDRGPGRQQAVVVVDEIRVPVVDPLMIGNVGIRGVNADAFSDDLGQRTASPHQLVIDIAGALLVPHQAAVFQPVIKTPNHTALSGRDVRIHSGFLRLSVDCRDPTLDTKPATRIVAC